MEILHDMTSWPRIWTVWIWMPVLMLALRRHQWAGAVGLMALMSIGFVLQGDLLMAMGWADGITGWIPLAGEDRAVIVYHFFLMVFAVLMILFPATRGIMLMGEVLSLFILSFIVSTFLMMV